MRVVLNKPRCPKCNAKDTRYRVDGTFICRACGYDSKKRRL